LAQLAAICRTGEMHWGGGRGLCLVDQRTFWDGRSVQHCPSSRGGAAMHPMWPASDHILDGVDTEAETLGDVINETLGDVINEAEFSLAAVAMRSVCRPVRMRCHRASLRRA
jgi:hypothetical protein